MPRVRDIDRQAKDIWLAGLAGADAKQLVRDSIVVSDSELTIAGRAFRRTEIERIRVIGAGKAAEAMANGLEAGLGPGAVLDYQVAGWVNVPGLAEERQQRVELSRKLFGRRSMIWRFPARPPDENLPTPSAYAGTLLMMDIVRQSHPNDLCICLISGGGSALMVRPVAGITIDDKRQVTSFLSGAGASIQELNTVRKQISAVKGGRLASDFSGKHLSTLIISDIIGDPLDLIASGPTVPDHSNASDAINILRHYDPGLGKIPRSIVLHLERDLNRPVTVPDNVSNHVIGSIQSAIAAAKRAAKSMDATITTEIQTDPKENVETAANRFVDWITAEANDDRRVLISGGEPVVNLHPRPGRGGRNQQLVLSALDLLMQHDMSGLPDFALLSAGTDLQDGNTLNAGAWITRDDVIRAQTSNLKPTRFLKTNDATTFFEKLLPERIVGYDAYEFTDSRQMTNVGDLRICVVSPQS